MMITSSDGLKSNTVFLAAKPQTFQHYIDDEGAGLGCGRRVCTLRKSVTMGSPNTYHVTIRYQTHHISIVTLFCYHKYLILRQISES